MEKLLQKLGIINPINNCFMNIINEGMLLYYELERVDHPYEADHNNQFITFRVIINLWNLLQNLIQFITERVLKLSVYGT